MHSGTQKVWCAIGLVTMILAGTWAPSPKVALCKASLMGVGFLVLWNGGPFPTWRWWLPSSGSSERGRSTCRWAHTALGWLIASVVGYEGYLGGRFGQANGLPPSGWVRLDTWVIHGSVMAPAPCRLVLYTGYAAVGLASVLALWCLVRSWRGEAVSAPHD